MSQIRAKQIRLDNQGDLIVGNSLGNGSVLPIGIYGQNLQVAGSSVSWSWQQTLYDPNGVIVADTNPSTGAVNYLTFEAGVSGVGPNISVAGYDTNIDIFISPAGTGEILSPVGYTSNIVSNNALVNKEYVDSVAAGLDWKNSVRVATVSAGDVSAFTYNVSAEPTGFVWTNVVSPVIDGVALVSGNRVMIKNATDQRGNGLFYYDATNTAFVRTNDANNTPNNEFSGGLAAYVEEGTNNGATAWIVVSPNGVANLGTDNITFSQFIGTNLYVAGSGLSLTGNTFSINESLTIGVVAGNIVVRSSNITNQVLLSQGNTNSPAIWGALPLNDSNSVTGILNVQNGGTGLNNVPENNVLVGTGTSSLALISGIPSTAELGYVLRTNSSGNILFGTLSIGQLSDVVFSATPAAGDILRFDGTNWVLASANVTDRQVAVNSAATPGYLKDVLVSTTSGAIVFTSAGNTLTAEVNYDDSTLIVVSGELVVGGGLPNQVLLGTSVSTAATWSYLDTLYNSNGSALFTVVGSGPNSLIYNANDNSLSLNTGNSAVGSIVVSGEDMFIDVSGYIYLNGIQLPRNVPAHSILVANTTNVLSALTTGGNENRYVIYRGSQSAFVMVSAGEFGLGNSFGLINLSGNTTGDLVISAGLVSDTLTFVGGNAIRLTGSAASRNITINFANVNMSSVPVQLDDRVVFFDVSNGDKPEYRSFDDIFSDLNVPYNLSGIGIPVQISAGVWVSRNIEASTSADRVGIEVLFGDGVSGNPTIGLNLEGLSSVTLFSADSTYIAAYRSSDDSNVRISVSNLIGNTVGNQAWASANAAGGSNETFTGFFTNLPINDDSIVVYFNGISLRRNGWTRSGNNLTMVDSVNGYSTSAGDTITASYRY
ncbi:MAG: hypothetical protein QXG00_05775 [Candidatus Woesearchaeota archaeon]